MTQSEPMKICGMLVAIAGRELALLRAALDLGRVGFGDTVFICHQVVELENEAHRVKGYETVRMTQFPKISLGFYVEYVKFPFYFKTI